MNTSEIAMPTPFLIAIEGIDGAGKTTMQRMLVDYLRELGFHVAGGKEPTQGPYGKQLRDSAASGRLSPERELELLILDRRQHVSEMIAPELAAGSIVILDRYYWSNAAYQGSEGLDVGSIIGQNETFAPRADAVLLLDIDPAVGIQRIRDRGDFPNQFEKVETLSRCREIFLAIPRKEIKVIDASKPIEEVFQRCLEEIVATFANKMHTLYGFSVEAAEAIRPFARGAYSEALHA